MNLDNLSEGSVVKNYKIMCKILEEKEKTGSSKISQIKEWERYFSYDKSGQSFIIKEIYDEPKEKEIQERKGIYNEIVQLLILNLLSQKEGSMIITKQQLTKEIGLTNENYTLGYRHRDRMSKFLNVDNLILNDFYTVNTASISKIIDNSLASLERKFIIDKQEIMMIQYNNEGSPRVANSFDREIVRAIKREALISLGLQEIDIKNRNANYYRFKELMDKLIKQRTQIKYHYKALDIVFSHKYLKQEMTDLTYEILSKLEFENKTNELNNLYSINAIKKAEIRHHEVSQDKINNETDETKELLLARFSDVYVNSFKKMTNTLIKIDAPLISKVQFFDNKPSKLSADTIKEINESLPF